MLNSFKDLAKPFKDPLNLPDDLVQKALKEEILETRKAKKATKSSNMNSKAK